MTSAGPTDSVSAAQRHVPLTDIVRGVEPLSSSVGLEAYKRGPMGFCGLETAMAAWASEKDSAT
jgi:hypothetical protein